jgi:hypothetical protein
LIQQGAADVVNSKFAAGLANGIFTFTDVTLVESVLKTAIDDVLEDWLELAVDLGFMKKLKDIIPTTSTATTQNDMTMFRSCFFIDDAS